ncbi:MAG: hypothetical protein ACI87A_002887 [Planctomycetota bacterium]|jgi:hypothetical protein
MKFNTQNNLSILAVSAAIAFSSCSTSEGGNGGAVGVNGVGGSDVGGFQLSSISIPESFVWKINRPVILVFTEAVDFSSVSLSSIAIRDSNNIPANGTFSFDPAQPRVVSFQPTCPIKSDFSDAGFLPGGKQYSLVVIGKDSGAGTSVRSAKGQELEVSQARFFSTPASTDLTSLFEDAVPGAPQPIIREVGDSSLNASFIEVAQDSTVVNRIYFERQMGSQTISQPGTDPASIPADHPLVSLASGMPLNLYSDQNSKIAFVIEVNQPVNPGPTNINSSRIRLEASSTPGGTDFSVIPSTVSLVRNCTTTGATLRVEPIGVLPQNVDIRVVVDASFEDLIGNVNSAPIQNFGVIRTRNAGDDLADELLEEFSLSGSTLGSLEDDLVAYSVPRAIWGDSGTLKPRFDFAGTGGPTGGFDFIVRAADGEVVLDTNFQPLLDANQTLSQTVIKGRLDVRNFTIEQGATLQLRGSDQMIINATGNVQIDGTIDLVGFDAKEVTGVFTASFPEPGASGNLGGGKGGDASSNKTASTPRGDHGQGPFGIFNGGGRGGEAGYGSNLPTDNSKQVQDSHPKHRRGGGGGGGVFAPDEDYVALSSIEPDFVVAGTKVQSGGTGDDLPASNNIGAITGLDVPFGGAPGPSAFVDGNDDNDFFGVRFDSATMSLVNGELTGLHAGSGGGGGGDSIRAKVFPNPKFSDATEDKGAAGGGGSGGLLIRALGDVKFGPVGRILADGGSGDRGQLIQFKNNFFFRSGAAGGGGSGGHVIIETGGQIDLGAGLDVISARGGRGGPGNKDAAVSSTNAKGGNGGPGVIQLHPASGAVTDILVNGMAVTDETELELLAAPRPNILLPNFGSISRARSDWIPLGGAVGANPEDVQFRFEGTDTGGLIERTSPTSGIVTDQASIIGPKNLDAATSGAVLVDEHTFSFDFTNVTGTTFAMANEIYRDNPVLMKNFLLVFTEDVAMSTTSRRYNIASAIVDPLDDERMLITTTSTGLEFSEFVGATDSQFPSLASVTFEIIPRFFRITTNGIEDRLPSNASIKILFEGTGRDAFGNPESTLLVSQEPLVTGLFDAGLAKPVEFFRFEVEFNIDALNAGLSASSPRPVIEFLRLPFEF